MPRSVWSFRGWIYGQSARGFCRNINAIIHEPMVRTAFAEQRTSCDDPSAASSRVQWAFSYQHQFGRIFADLCHVWCVAFVDGFTGNRRGGFAEILMPSSTSQWCALLSLRTHEL